MALTGIKHQYCAWL